MDGTTTRWFLELWHPTPLNELIGNRFKATRLKRADRETVALMARRDGIPKATGKRRVGITILLGKYQREKDPDAYWKSLLDAMVHAKLLVDDREKWCEQGAVKHERTKGRTWGTLLTLEDI